MSGTVHLIRHPLVQHKLTLMRKKDTSTSSFRSLLAEISMLLCYEVTRDLPLATERIETPIAAMDAPVLDGKKVVIVSVLRAGGGILEGMLRILPSARVGHVGMYRDHETLQPVEYYYRMPGDLADREVIVVDPMLATGNSAVAAVSRLLRDGPKSVKFVCLLAAPEGHRRLPRGAPRRARVHGRDRRAPQRARLHRAGPRRRGRSALRDEVGRRAVHVLVVGGTRFVGALTVWRLLARGERVTLLTRGLTRDDFGDRVERLVADRTSAGFGAALAGRRFDAVIDFVAFTGDDTRGVIDALGARAGHYVLVSTGQVYLVREGVRGADGRARRATEDDYDGPLIARPEATADAVEWDYGVGKRAAEDALVEAGTRFPATRVRLPMVHGPRDPYRRLEGYLARMLDGGPVLVPDGGAAIARHVFAQDVAETLCALLGDARTAGRAYNVAQAETPTVWELVGRLAQRLGAPDRRVALPAERLGAIPPTAVSPLSGRWMSLLDPARAVAELGLRHRPLDAWLDATIAGWLAAPPAAPPESYLAHRARERDLARG